MKQDMKEQLLTKTPLSLMFQLSIPAVVGMVVIGLYPLMDGIFAGNIIGQSAMTACGVALPLTFFNSGTSTLLGVGSASILSRALGKGDKETVDKIMGNLIYWVILFSVIILNAGCFGGDGGVGGDGFLVLFSVSVMAFSLASFSVFLCP